MGKWGSGGLRIFSFRISITPAFAIGSTKHCSPPLVCGLQCLFLPTTLILGRWIRLHYISFYSVYHDDVDGPILCALEDVYDDLVGLKPS